MFNILIVKSLRDSSSVSLQPLYLDIVNVASFPTNSLLKCTVLWILDLRETVQIFLN